MREDRLVAALVDLGEHLDVPSARDLAPAVIASLRDAEVRPRSRSRRRVLAVVLAATAVFALPGPREALADWLGLRTVHIVHVDTLPSDLGTTLNLGHEVPLDQLRAGAFTVLTAPPLGAPSRTYTGEPSAASVTLVWTAAGLTPVGDGVGVLLTEIPGSLAGPSVEKRLTNDTSIVSVTVRDGQGYWLTGGRHEVLYLAPDGRVRPDTTRFAANTLLWSDGDVTFRLESNLGKDDAIALANSLRPL